MVSTEDYTILDCRFSLTDEDAGRRAWEAGHIPTAQHADLNRQLSGPIIPGQTGRHPLPAREVFLQQVRDWGVKNHSQVIAYDDNHGAFAARLWWMLRWLGHEHCALLDGGLDAWVAAGHPLTTESREVASSKFEAATPLTRTLEASQIPDAPGVLVDARDPARFRGEADSIDPVAGHIPGAVCLPFSGNLREGRFRSPEALAERFEQAGISPGTRVTCYCGSGVTAAHNILALKHAGFDEAALYPGSWSEWITDPERPVSTGE